jgi:Domain of unknown function (DUF4292)
MKKMKKHILILLSILAVSCKTKAIIAAKSNVTEKTETEKIIEGHYSNKATFSSLYLKAGASYQDDKQTQSASLEIRIKKDETIMVSIRFLGITMAKALITPNRVQYYDKINGKYFDGDYAALTSFLGSDLDFQKIQNLFIGQAIDDLSKEKYNNYLEDKMYKLENFSNPNTLKAFYFNDKFVLTREIISQLLQKRTLKVNYTNFKDYPIGKLPENIFIEATQEKGNSVISLEYNSVTFNEELNFPYSVPEGYERVIIK